MVKIERTPTPPASLAIESRKAHGSYTENDVVQQLHEDFHGKCYICELEDLPDVQVEHLLPHKNRTIPERVFDWNNLFFSCPHCNNIKAAPKYDDKILNCCAVDPEEYLYHIYSAKHVSVVPAAGITCKEAVMTADLITCSFEKNNTGIREDASKHRFKKLADKMNMLFKTLQKHKENPSAKRHTAALRSMLSRESGFAAFTRHYVRSHIADYPDLKDLVS